MVFFFGVAMAFSMRLRPGRSEAKTSVTIVWMSVDWEEEQTDRLGLVNKRLSTHVSKVGMLNVPIWRRRREATKESEQAYPAWFQIRCWIRESQGESGRLCAREGRAPARSKDRDRDGDRDGDRGCTHPHRPYDATAALARGLSPLGHLLRSPRLACLPLQGHATARENLWNVRLQLRRHACSDLPAHGERVEASFHHETGLGSGGGTTMTDVLERTEEHLDAGTVRGGSL